MLTITLGREASFSLLEVVQDLQEWHWKGSLLRKCKENDKVFLLEAGANFRREFLSVIESLEGFIVFRRQENFGYEEDDVRPWQRSEEDVVFC